jgi:hypothetical protein
VLRVLDDDESRVDDLSAAPAPSDDPVSAWNEYVMSDPVVETDPVDPSVAPDVEGPDALACGRDLDDHELDERRPSEDEDEGRPTMPGRSATRDPVARQAEPVDASGARGLLPRGRSAGTAACGT